MPSQNSESSTTSISCGDLTITGDPYVWCITYLDRERRVGWHQDYPRTSRREAIHAFLEYVRDTPRGNY